MTNVRNYAFEVTIYVACDVRIILLLFDCRLHVTKKIGLLWFFLISRIKQNMKDAPKYKNTKKKNQKCKITVSFLILRK